MIQLIILSLLTLLINQCRGNYHGPYLLWGHNNLEHGNLPALEAMNERSLTLMYADAKAIILFVRNGTSKLNKDNFPNFSSLISQNRWLYLPQEHLPAEPVDYNSNVEVITLVGPAQQQDIELGALYRDAVSTYGEGKVLGILSTQSEEAHYMYKREVKEETQKENQHYMYKREVKEENEKEDQREPEPEPEAEEETEEDKEKQDKATPESDSQKKERKEKESQKEKDNDKEKKEEELPTEVTEDEKIESDHVYLSKTKKSLLYTTSDPILKLEMADRVEIFNLSDHGDVTTDERKDYARLIIHFKVDNYKLYVRLRFPLSAGYWAVGDVEIEYRDIKIALPLVTNSPSAPIGFSYKCEQNMLLFQNGSNSLAIRDYQIEPLIPNELGRFSDVYDCVDFTTVPIWSGVFVSMIMVGVTFIGILLIMDIKAPNRFESSRSKQLTFTVQE